MNATKTANEQKQELILLQRDRWSKQIEMCQILTNMEADGWRQKRVMEFKGIIKLYNHIH